MTTTDTDHDPFTPVFVHEGNFHNDEPIRVNVDDADLMLMSILGIAVMYEVWLIMGTDEPDRVLVTATFDGPRLTTHRVREYHIPSSEWATPVVAVACRWTMEHALQQIEAEGLY